MAIQTLTHATAPASQAQTGALLPLHVTPPPLRAHLVLIADDEASNRGLLSMVLKSAGLHCEEVADGILALEALAARPFDLDVKAGRG